MVLNFQGKFYRFELPKVLAFLIVERESYSYVDKIGYAQSRDLLLFHIREALRDWQTLIRSGVIREESHIQIDYGKIENDIRIIAKINSGKELREVSSLIAGEALALASKLTAKQES